MMPLDQERTFSPGLYCQYRTKLQVGRSGALGDGNIGTERYDSSLIVHNQGDNKATTDHSHLTLFPLPLF